MQANPIETLYNEHDEVLERLERLDALLAAPAPESGSDLESIIRYLEEDLETHLLREEQALFPVLERHIGREGGPIAVMLMEHEELRHLVVGLRRAFDAWRKDPVPAHGGPLTAIGGEMAALLREHVTKENQVLFPLAERALSEAETQEVKDRMAKIDHSSQREGGVSMDAKVEVDVRPVPPPYKHPMIFQAFEGLAPGETMILINDHDPKPLYYHFAAEMPGRFGWEYLEQGPEVWRVAISRV